MTNDSNDAEDTNKEQFSESVKSRKDELFGSELARRREDSEKVEKGGEVVDPNDVPDGGYEMVPTRNNPDRGNRSDGDSGGDEE